ncbi:E2 domain-containing protein [Azospirillum sp. sgz302134]
MSTAAAPETAGSLDALVRSPQISRLCRTALADGHEVLSMSPGRAALRISIPMASGRLVPFDIAVETRVGDLVAREAPGSSNRRLPSACPERHINEDGTFCLYWRDGAPIDASTEDGARQWLDALVAYLRQQLRTNVTRRWPAEFGWAHGKAALHQQLAELKAALVSPALACAVRRREITVDRKGLALLLNGRRVVAKAKNRPTALVNLRKACPCGRTRKGRPVSRRDCSDHMDFLIDVIGHVHDLQRTEAGYIAALKAGGFTCCGTMDACPFKANGEPRHDNPKGES